MATLIIGIVLVLFAVSVGIWWRISFAHANPPLPRTVVTITSSSTSTVATTTVAVATTTSATAPTSSTDVDIDRNPPLPTEKLSIDSTTFNVEIASTMMEQARGLSNRPSLGANDGMLFVFSTGSIQTFWMKDMNFPLDMIWISGNTVVGFSQNDPAEPNVAWPPGIYWSPANTDKVLEVNAGTVAKYNIKVGDSVEIQ